MRCHSFMPLGGVGVLVTRPARQAAGFAQKLPDLPAGSRVLGFNYDTGERYLSIEGFLPAE